MFSNSRIFLSPPEKRRVHLPSSTFSVVSPTFSGFCFPGNSRLNALFFGIRPFAISDEVRSLSVSLRSAGSDRSSRSEHSLSYSRKLKTAFCSRVKTNRGLKVLLPGDLQNRSHSFWKAAPLESPARLMKSS